MHCKKPTLLCYFGPFSVLWSVYSTGPRHRRRFWHATHDCVSPYIDIILHRGWFWAKSAASGSIRWYCFRSCWTVLSHVMRGPSCLLQSARGEANRILLASALSSMRIICPNRVSRRDWIIAVSLGLGPCSPKCGVGTSWKVGRLNSEHLPSPLLLFPSPFLSSPLPSP